MKILKTIGFTVIAVLLFFGGYFTNQVLNPVEVSREVRIGYANDYAQDPGQIDIKKVYTDLEEQHVVDNTMMIFMNKQPVERATDADPADMYIWMLNPKDSTGLIEARVWFDGEGAVIGQRAGEGWDQVEYFSISEQDAAYLKEQGEFEES
ncbi:hypothetical protein KP77_09670 [Jeotgalibacillus alimentarius]|uniref:Uncharacterized protein n=1 Tax=Jeotgalibacillus alimentarius TaxID=135826 RepID=A0A0C2RMI2_9BACL|nr:hypothetical protein [Jeotgalibacillus alimentarius]KIL51455.1 hypothetical protein KP77_09670 [Jeotgalibacillus alimentarius]